MKKNWKLVNAFSRLDQKGQGLTEYITLLLLVAVCSIVAVQTLGSRIKSKIQQATEHINSDISLDAQGKGKKKK
jgi:Flp pilus assembly pilin Flp